MMAFTMILALLALFALAVIFAITLKLKGLKFAFISTGAALVIVSLLYVATIYAIASLNTM